LITLNSKIIIMHWYEIKNIASIDSPALIIYQERIQENIRLLKQMVNNDLDRLRPHVKTNKMAEVCSIMMDAGIYKFKCATIAEAEMLAMIGAKDVLLAYQPVGPKVGRFIQLIIQYPATSFSCIVDNIQSAQYLSTAAIGEQLSLAVFLDVNIGMNRTGITPPKALFLFEAIQLLAGIRVIGLHVYDGHIRDTDVVLRKQQVDMGLAKLKVLAETIEALSDKKMVIVAGGSPTFPIHAALENSECSPGTFVFWDWGYKHLLPDEPFDYAALVITRVISIIDEHTIATDLGHKSVAAETPLPRIHFLNAPDTVPISQSEEHLVVKVADSAIYQPGDVFYGVPVHICPTVALYEAAVVVKQNSAVEEWKVIARNRKITV
jgi:D-serine deaminase-like pyridoxal phosphate-dependent protein